MSLHGNYLNNTSYSSRTNANAVNFSWFIKNTVDQIGSEKKFFSYVSLAPTDKFEDYKTTIRKVFGITGEFQLKLGTREITELQTLHTIRQGEGILIVPKN
jgi:hypothetical protein